MLFDDNEGDAFLWELSEAIPRPLLRLLALGVTSSPHQ